MSIFNPRSKNIKYQTRSTNNQFEFTSSDVTDNFVHTRDLRVRGELRGRNDQGYMHRRDNLSYEEIYLTLDEVRNSDTPYDYYGDPRALS